MFIADRRATRPKATVPSINATTTGPAFNPMTNTGGQSHQALEDRAVHAQAERRHQPRACTSVRINP